MREDIYVDTYADKGKRLLSLRYEIGKKKEILLSGNKRKNKTTLQRKGPLE